MVLNPKLGSDAATIRDSTKLFIMTRDVQVANFASSFQYQPSMKPGPAEQAAHAKLQTTFVDLESNNMEASGGAVESKSGDEPGTTNRRRTGVLRVHSTVSWRCIVRSSDLLLT